MKKWFLSTAYCALVASTGCCQVGALGEGKPWPKLYEITIQAGVSAKGPSYTYSFSVYNSTENVFPITRIEIDLRLYPEIHPLVRQDLVMQHSADEHINILTQALRVPVEEIKSPPHWKKDYPGSWWISPQDQMLEPGQKLHGFVIASKFPPGIREYVVDGYSWDFVANSEGYDFKGTAEQLTVEVNKGIQYLGRTIAPVAPPDPFTASAWTARMLFDAAEARKLGWIKTDEQLAQIKGLISALNAGGKRKLKKAVKEIERYVLAEKKAGRVTDEADALLRLNALYLLRRVEVMP